MYAVGERHAGHDFGLHLAVLQIDVNNGSCRETEICFDLGQRFEVPYKKVMIVAYEKLLGIERKDRIRSNQVRVLDRPNVSSHEAFNVELELLDLRACPGMIGDKKGRRLLVEAKAHGVKVEIGREADELNLLQPVGVEKTAGRVVVHIKFTLGD
jgi:hypothetical protein